MAFDQAAFLARRWQRPGHEPVDAVLLADEFAKLHQYWLTDAANSLRGRYHGACWAVVEFLATGHVPVMDQGMQYVVDKFRAEYLPLFSEVGRGEVGRGPGRCARCGSPLTGTTDAANPSNDRPPGFCSDQTCPYNDRPQDDDPRPIGRIEWLPDPPPAAPDFPYGVSPSGEAFVRLPSGAVVAFASAACHAEGTSYVRFLAADGGEFAYWNSDEWAEAPVEVMGAVCGALLADPADAGPRQYYQFAPDCVFPAGVEYQPYGEG